LQIRFSVSYTLSEYRSFIRDHAPPFLETALAKDGKAPSAKRSAIALWFVVNCTSLIYFYKKLRMPVCDFTIDEDKISRTTRMGELVVPWSRVATVHRYSRGYLVVKLNGGALPIPYRCVAREDAAALSALIERKTVST
jgi:hypothetical protein